VEKHTKYCEKEPYPSDGLFIDKKATKLGNSSVNLADKRSSREIEKRKKSCTGSQEMVRCYGFRLCNNGDIHNLKP